MLDSFRKLDPRLQLRNPVMFVVEVGSMLTTALWVQALFGRGEAPAGFIGAVTLWLWFTVLFANFAEAAAEGRGKAQAEALRRTRQTTQAKRLSRPRHDAEYTRVPSTSLRKGDVFLVEPDDLIASDGEVIEGIASVDESAVTGESAPVIRESGGDRSAVTGGTRLLSDWLIVRVTADPGEGFLDRMIGLIEGARRQKTPNEIALNILLAGFTIIFLAVCATLLPYSLYSVQAVGQGTPITITVLVALLVCLIPTTIGGLLSAIGPLYNAAIGIGGNSPPRHFQWSLRNSSQFLWFLDANTPPPGSFTPAEHVMAPAAAGLELSVSPSPANGGAPVRFQLPAAAIGAPGPMLSIYDVSGKLIVAPDDLYPGAGSIVWKAGNMRSGLYIARLKVAGKIVTKPFLLVK
jgi:hypothetical protein